MMEEPDISPDQRERGVLPVVVRQRAGLPAWLLIALAAVAALLLFAVLEARRRVAQVPSVKMGAMDLSMAAPVPMLGIPPEPVPSSPVSAIVPTIEVPPPVPPSAPAHHAVANVPRYLPAPSIVSPPSDRFLSPASGAAVVIDNSAGPRATNGQLGSNGTPTAIDPAAATARVHAGMLQNRSTTVMQGTLIHAVLETGFDSTRPGFARATVSRDIRGFDGTRVLIPRGSRLIGEYQGDVRAGQSRALIVWTRLIRPDGATIEIGSPASDPVGRGGVKADVNTHFLQRFSGAILQSVLDVGVNLASRSANSSVIVALPSSSGLTGQIVQPTNVTPTLTVRPATSISIFVARDLDFTEVEDRR